MRVRLVVAVLCLVSFVVFVNAASQATAISGVVTDASGAVLPGVTVTIVGSATHAAVTDQQGRFLVVVSPGTYKVQFELTGFTKVIRTAIVETGKTTPMTVQLSVGMQEQIVTVLASSPLVDTQNVASLRSLAPHQLAFGVGSGNGVGGRVDGNRPIGRFNTETYDRIDDNPFRRVSAHPLSTFSIDVDTASYANVRRFLNEGKAPPDGAVRIEELINYFRFDYAAPAGEPPVAMTTELAACPWNPRHLLALVGLRARDIREEHLPARNLVFLLDVSGSMNSPDKLPLVQQAMQMLTQRLTERDRVAIVTYAGRSGVALPSTGGDRRAAIHDAIAELSPGGSTNGGAGIRLAYRLAREHFVPGGINRVILATDGDFNVGITSQDELIRVIEEERASGVFLSVLGVGAGNLKDSTMEKLADKGNGNYSYLDSLHEARKVLVRESGSTLMTVAKDVKIQVEFNPAQVDAYRLIGYENRLLNNEDFKDDSKDAGEMGAGHTVTALYEIVPHGVGIDAADVDPLKYQQPVAAARSSARAELMTVKLRYKLPDSTRSQVRETVIGNQPKALKENLGFAAAVAEYGMLLRHSTHAGTASYASASGLARTFRGRDPDNDRQGFIALVERAADLRRAADSGSQRPRLPMASR